MEMLIKTRARSIYSDVYDAFVATKYEIKRHERTNNDEAFTERFFISSSLNVPLGGFLMRF